jgi:hypothetical protein
LFIFAGVLLAIASATLLRSPRRKEPKPREVFAELVGSAVLGPATRVPLPPASAPARDDRQAQPSIPAPPPAPPPEAVTDPVETNPAEVDVSQTAAASIEEASAEATEEYCEIALWRGYTKSRFFARLEIFEDEDDIAVAESPSFRSAGNGVPDRTEAAEAAHSALIRRLLEDGWLLEDVAEPWYASRLWRPLAEGSQADA